MSDLQTMTEGPAPRRERDRRFAALAVLMIAGLFCGITIGVMVATRALDPDPAELREHTYDYARTLQSDPSNEALAEQLVEEDAAERGRFWSNRRRLGAGVVLLLVGAVALVVAARYYAAHDKVLPEPGSPIERGDPDVWTAGRRHGLAALAVGLVVMFALAGVFGVVGGADLPEPADEEVANRATADTPVDSVEPYVLERSEFVKHWPSFRGPNGDGVAPAGDYAREWNGADGANVVWKAEVPLPGTGSPVIWGDRVFVTGASDVNTQEVFCYRRADGELLWRTPIRADRDWQGRVDLFDATGHAAPTPVADGERVYVWFASADLAAVDFDGKVVWQRNLGKPVNRYGISSSPAFHRDALIVQHDQGDTDLSALLFLDPRTGKERASISRSFLEDASWSSPVVADTPDGVRLLTSGMPFLVCYDPEERQELWRAEVLGGEIGPSPIHRDGVVYATNDQAALTAISAGGTGNVTESHVRWTALDGASDAASPVCDGKYVVQVTSAGFVTCYKANYEGDEEQLPLWEHYLEPSADFIWASPSLVGGLVYITDTNGLTHILRPGDQLEVVGQCPLGESVSASPALMDGRIYMRGGEHLFCIGKEAQ